tara:strand:+ start:23 stop:541 length:519 start_codon:yes stop_codon:yes gene_type:complete
MATILQSPIVVELILPFLLVFAVIFAILQKTKILGDGKRQIDAIVALVVGLIVVAFGQAVGIIVNLIPILAVTAIVILVFMILYGMVFTEGSFVLNKWLKGGIGFLVGIIVVISVFILTGVWDYIIDFYETTGSGALLANVAFIIVIIVAIVSVLRGGSDSSGSSSSDSKSD